MKFTKEQIKLIHRVICMPGYSELIEEFTKEEMKEITKMESEMREVV